MFVSLNRLTISTAFSWKRVLYVTSVMQIKLEIKINHVNY